MLEYYSAEFRIFHTLPRITRARVECLFAKCRSVQRVMCADATRLKSRQINSKKNDDSPRRNRSSDDSIINAMIVFRRIKMCI